MFSQFQSIYCINLRRNTVRWTQFLKNAENAGLVPSRIHRFEAVDGQLCPPPMWWRAGAGAWGCMQSHIRILEQALSNGTESLLILEDDAVPVANLLQQAQEFFSALPCNWDYVLLGGQHLKIPRTINQAVVRVTNGNRTHAYGLRGEAIATVYRHLCDYAAHAQSPTHHVDHRLGVLHESKRLNVYAPTRWLFSQAEGSSDICHKRLPPRSWSFVSRPLIGHTDNQVDAAGKTPSPPVVVLGTYRSGTSCVAAVLQQLGYYLGSHLAGPNQWNPSGYFESTGLAAKLRLLLDEPRLAEPAPGEYLVDLLRAWLLMETGAVERRSRPLAVKSPLFCLLVPEILRAWGSHTRLVVVDRDPDKALASLKRTAWWPQECCERVHQLLVERLDALPTSPTCYRLPYEKLMADPLLQIGQLAAWLNHSLSEPDLAAAARVVRRQF